MSNWTRGLQRQFNEDFTRTGLRVAITAWALVVIVLAWALDNKWLLAGILAWEVLP